MLDDAHGEDCKGRGARAPRGLTRTTRAERQTARAPARNGRPAGLIGVLPPKCWAFEGRRKSWPAGWWPRRSSSRIGARRGAGPANESAVRRLRPRACMSSATRTGVRSTSEKRSTCGGGCARTSWSDVGAPPSRDWRGRLTRSGILVGSEIEALLREAVLIQELQPAVNVQIGPPDPADARGAAGARSGRARPRPVGSKRTRPSSSPRASMAAA